jgi:hypothetical protein
MLKQSPSIPNQQEVFMPLDLALLATTVVSSFLMPYAKKAMEKVAEITSEKFGDAAAKAGTDVAQKVWIRIKSAFTSEKEKATLEQFEEFPDAAKPLVEAVLKKKLEEDPALRDDLDKLANTPLPGGSTGAQIMQAGIAGVVDLRGATISGSGQTFAGVSIGSSSAGQPTDKPGVPPRRD